MSLPHGSRTGRRPGLVKLTKPHLIKIGEGLRRADLARPARLSGCRAVARRAPSPRTGGRRSGWRARGRLRPSPRRGAGAGTRKTRRARRRCRAFAERSCSIPSLARVRIAAIRAVWGGPRKRQPALGQLPHAPHSMAPPGPGHLLQGMRPAFSRVYDKWGFEEVPM